MQKVGIIPGDGIGPEVVKEARKVLDAVSEKKGLTLEFEEFPLGAAHYLKTGEILSDETLQRLSKKDAILLSPFPYPALKGGDSGSPRSEKGQGCRVD